MLKKIAILLLICSTALAVTKVKSLKVGSNGVATETNQTTDYIAAKGMAFDNSDSTVIDASGGFIQLTHNGVTAPACFQATTTLTAGGILFSDSSSRNTQDASNLFYTDADDAMCVGPSASTDSITISGSSIKERLASHSNKAGTDLIDLHLWSGSTSAGQGPRMSFHRNKNTIASPSTVASGDELGMISFGGYDGTDYEETAAILGEVDGSVSNNTVPTRLRFMTGPTNAMVEAMRIDSAKLTTHSGNVQMSANTIFGDTASGGNLLLKSTSNSTKGVISLDDATSLWVDHPSSITSSEDVLKYSPTNTISVSGATTNTDGFHFTPTFTIAGGGSDVITHDSIHLTPTITFNSGLAFLHYGLLYDGTFTLTANPGFGNTFALFYAQNTIQSSTASVPPPGGSIFADQTTIKSSGGVNTGTTGGFTTFSDAMTYLASGASTTSAVTGHTSFTSGPTFSSDNATSSLTTTSRIGFRAKDPGYTSTGVNTLTNNIGFQFDNQSQTSGNRTVTTIKGISLSQNTGASTTYNIYEDGTSPNVFTGTIRAGDTTVATQPLEVKGNVLIDNGGTAGELRLREPSGSGSNYTAFKAQAQAGNVTYILPAADASVSGYFLSSDGSGNLSWASASTSAPPYVHCFADTSMTGTGTNTEMSYGNGTAARIKIPFASHIIALSCNTSTARTAGSANFKALINGSADSNNCTLDGTTTTNQTVTGLNVAVTAGQTLGAAITTSSWTPTAADPLLCIYLTKD